MKFFCCSFLFAQQHKSCRTQNSQKKEGTVIIKSMKSKVPVDFQSFLKSDDSKARIDLLLDYRMKYKTKVLNISKCMKIYFSKYNQCKSIFLSSVDNVLYFSCEQKEAGREFLITVSTF